MIVNCEECGKGYSIDENNIKGEMAKFTCRACNHVNIVTNPNSVQTFDPGDFDEPGAFEEPQPQNGEKASTAAVDADEKQGLGIRSKMMVLFIVVPVLLMLCASTLYVKQLKNLSKLITTDSTKIVEQMAEQIILEKGEAVAREARLYLEAHPRLKKEDFNNTIEFKRIAQQKVGETGYTLLVERRTRENPKEIMWIHPVAKLVGIDMEPALKKRLGDKWASWAKIRSADQTRQGYYLWYDNREKYCANVPIPGTTFNIVSSTYIDEFRKPMEDLKGRATSMENKIMFTVIVILALTTLFIAVITFFYGNSLSGKIKYLTNVADRISKGELDADITLKDKDEVGVLASAIGRMQASIQIFLNTMRQ